MNDFEEKNVVFEEGRNYDQHSSSKTPKMVAWIMNNSGGIIKDEKQANLVLLGIVILFVIISIFFISNSKKNVEEMTEEDVRQMDAELFLNQ